MKRDIESQYREQFGCRIVLDCCTHMVVLITPGRKSYVVDDVPDEELHVLMRESVDKGENVLLERVKDKAYKFKPEPNCDY